MTNFWDQIEMDEKMKDDCQLVESGDAVLEMYKDDNPKCNNQDEVDLELSIYMKRGTQPRHLNRYLRKNKVRCRVFFFQHEAPAGAVRVSVKNMQGDVRRVWYLDF